MNQRVFKQANYRANGNFPSFLRETSSHNLNFPSERPVTVAAVDLGLLGSFILSAALQLAAAAAARQRQGICGHVHAVVTAHAQVTFSTLLNKEPPVQCSWEGPFSAKDTGKTPNNLSHPGKATRARLVLLALSCLMQASS